MFETRLTTTSSEGLQPLGSAAQRSFELVSDTVRNLLSAEHANLFAEPIATEHGDMIDWYAPVSGAAVPISALDETQAQDLRAKLGGLVGDIRDEAIRLAESADVQDQRLAEALSNAIEIPDDTKIYALRQPDGEVQPVLVHWAWLSAERQSVRGILTAMVPRPQPVTSQMTGAVAEDDQSASPVWCWLLLLGWLLLAAIIAYILYLLIAPCGLKGGRPFFCPKPAPEISAIPLERQVLEDEIAALRHEIALMDRSCQPTIPVLPAPPPKKAKSTEKEPVPTPQKPAPEDKTERNSKEIIRDLEARGAKRAELNFALSWNTLDDIDLAVTCPTGQTISYSNRGDCDGTLDLDANVTRAGAITDPVENIVFDAAKPGIYIVKVRLKSNRGDGEKPVTLHVLRRDGRSMTYSGTVSDKAPEWSLNISISR